MEKERQPFIPMRSMFALSSQAPLPRPYLSAHHTGTVVIRKIQEHRECSRKTGQMDSLPPMVRSNSSSSGSSSTQPPQSFQSHSQSVSMSTCVYPEPVPPTEYVMRCNLGQLRLKTVSFPAVYNYRTSRVAEEKSKLTVQRLGGEPLSALCRGNDAYLLKEQMMEKVRDVQAELFRAGYLYFKPSLHDFRWYENKLWMEHFTYVFHYVSEAMVMSGKDAWKKRMFEEVKKSVEEHEGKTEEEEEKMV